MPRVAMASMGGTISMTATTAGGGVQPALGVEDVLAAVPSVQRIASLETTTLASLPGASLSFADVLSALRWADAAVADGASGAVLMQGTDTLEETAYLLDLHWARPEPLVVTGAMRPPDAPGADGPANLLAATVSAASPASRSLGVLVVMNDEVHTAVRVRKGHATATHAFGSADFGPVGRVLEGAVVYGNRPTRWPPLPRPAADASPRVALLETCLADDAGLLRLAVGDGYDGVVVASFGAGHVSADLAEAMEQAAQAVPVVHATRTGGGTTLAGTYGFAGSESDLLARGALAAGWIDPRKARVLLWSLLASGASRKAIAAELSRRGHSPGGPTPDG